MSEMSYFYPSFLCDEDGGGDTNDEIIFILCSVKCEVSSRGGGKFFATSTSLSHKLSCFSWCGISFLNLSLSMFLLKHDDCKNLT